MSRNEDDEKAEILTSDADDDDVLDDDVIDEFIRTVSGPNPGCFDAMTAQIRTVYADTDTAIKHKADIKEFEDNKLGALHKKINVRKGKSAIQRNDRRARRDLEKQLRELSLSVASSREGIALCLSQ